MKKTPLIILGLFLSAVMSSTVAESRGFFDNMLFHPRRNYSSIPQALDGVARKDVTFRDSKGEQLKGWYFDLPGSDKIVLVSEGNGGNMIYLTKVAEILMQCKSSVLLYDYEGYGESEGSPSIRRVVDDGLCAFDFMKKSLAGDKKIVVLGVSLGTGVTCQIADRRKVDAIILTSPFTSLLNMARQKVGYLKYVPTLALPRQHLDNVAILRKSHAPLLILHGDADTMIPISESEKLFAEAAEPKTFVKLAHAGHNDIFRNNREAYQVAVKSFLDEVVH